MNDREFRDKIKSGLTGGYLIYGDEEYLKDYYLGLAVKSVIGDDDFSAVNLVECDEDSYSDSFLEDALSAVPMMAERCAAVVRVRFSDLKDTEKNKIYERLSSYGGESPVVLFFVIPTGYFDEGNLKKNRPSPEYKALTEHLEPVAFPFQTPSVLKKWTARHLAADGITTTDDVLDYIVEMCGPDMTGLSCEIEKLACYVLSKGLKVVCRADVDFVCTPHGEPDAFALSNAVVTGDRAGALAAIRDCRDKKQKPTAVVAKMTSEFMNMLSVTLCMKDGMMKQEIAKKLGIHEFRVGKYMESLANTEIASVRAVLSRAVEADAALKSSGGGYEVLERLVCTIPSKKRNLRGYR